MFDNNFPLIFKGMSQWCVISMSKNNILEGRRVEKSFQLKFFYWLICRRKVYFKSVFLYKSES